MILVFPGPDALTLEEYVAKFSKPQSVHNEDPCDHIQSLRLGQSMADDKNSEMCRNCDSADGGSAATCQALLRDSDASTSGVGARQAEDKNVRFEKTFDRVVFIDSTWHQVYKIRLDERLSCEQSIFTLLFTFTLNSMSIGWSFY